MTGPPRIECTLDSFHDGDCGQRFSAKLLVLIIKSDLQTAKRLAIGLGVDYLFYW